jgi:hypothetical protein
VPGPRAMVDPPRFTPSPYGLLSVAELRGGDGGDPHWQNGVTYEERCPTPTMGGSTYDECISVTGTGAPPPPPPKADNWNRQYRGATPLTVFTQFDCSPVGLDQARDAAEVALAQAEGWQLERAVWTGRAAGVANIVFPHLAHTAAAVSDAQGLLLQSQVVTVTGGPYPAARGLGALEGALADCMNGQGVIHVPQLALPTLSAAEGLLERRGATLQTANGNQVAVGAGYPGTAPDGSAAAAGTAWLFATGPVIAYRSGARVIGYGREAMDRAENTMRLLAERTFVVGWSCCHFAVQINL